VSSARNAGYYVEWHPGRACSFADGQFVYLDCWDICINYINGTWAFWVLSRLWNNLN
jgi:hypothetical protein